MFKFLSKLAGDKPKGESGSGADDASGPQGEAISPDEYSPEVVDKMAEEMSPKQGIDWASQSGRMVEDKLPPEDVNALDAAEKWKADPTEKNADAAAREANKANHQGPGAWAAQAASWASEAVGPAAHLLEQSGSAPLVAEAVSGAVKLAAAATAPPPASAAEAAGAASQAVAEQAGDQAADAVVSQATDQATAKALKPFIDLGKKIMSGGSSA